MFSKFKHIRSNIAALMVILIVFLIAITLISVYLYTKELFTNQILKDNKAIADKISIQIDNDLNSIQEYSNNIIYSDEIQSLMRQYYTESGFNYYSVSNDISLRLSRYSLLKSEIIFAMYIVDNTGKNQVSVSEVHGNINEQQWYREITEKEGADHFSHAYSNVKDAGIPIDIISYIAEFNDLNNPSEQLGSLIININYKALFSKLSKENDNNKPVYIIDQYNNVVFSNTDNQSDEKKFDYDILNNNEAVDSADFIYITCPIEKLEYIIIMELPKQEINSSISKIFQIIIMIFALSLIITIVLIFPFSKNLTKPITALSNGMNDVAEGNFDKTIQIEQNNELKEMADSFNNMTSKIKLLLAEIELGHQKEKEMQIKLFMSKINPHFIYNTLYSIVSLASKEGSMDIENLTKAFINILRRNIVVDETNISIKDEIEYLNNYIYILKYQYGDMISIEYNIDEEVLNYNLRPMILYPIVENSIFHGIAPKGKKGKVCVNINRNGEKLDIRISDDGIGMPESKLEEIKEHLNSYNSNAHVGLKSVFDRLKFFYGENNSFKIESKIKRGTTVSFSVHVGKLF